MDIYKQYLDDSLEKLKDGHLSEEAGKALVERMELVNDIRKEDNRRDEELKKIEHDEISDKRRFIKDIVDRGLTFAGFTMATIITINLEKDGFIKSTLGKMFVNKQPFGKL